MKKNLLTMRNDRLFLFGLLISLIIIGACRKSNFSSALEPHINKTYKEYVVNYQSSIKDSVLHFELEISKTGKLTDIVNEDFEIDLKENKFRNNIYSILKERSLNNRYSDITLQQAREICVSLTEIIAQSTKALALEQLKSPNILGMQISLGFARRMLKNKLGISPLESTIIAKKRTLGIKVMDVPVSPTLNVQPSYAQDVYEGYELGISAFVMNEDIIINKQALLDVVNQDALALVQDDKGLYVFQAVLNSIPYTSFSLKDFLNEVDFYVQQHPENFLSGGSGCAGGWWPSGHSHGCCGNYNGCCYYWHVTCYLHDIICKKCTPRWFCFSGCVPDPVLVGSSPSPPPFTFIETASVIVEPGPGQGIFLPFPLPSEISYKIDYNQLGVFTPVAVTNIFFSYADYKYYNNSAFNNLLPDGYYDSPNEIIGYNHKYYHIVNGVVLQVHNVLEGF